MDAAGWLARSEAFLAARGVEESLANAEFLLAAVLGVNRGALKLRLARPLRRKDELHFWGLVEKRGRRLPLAYVLGSQPFMGLDMEASPAALVPRPETEEVVDEAVRLLRAAGQKEPHILEIGTGTGCVSVALAKSFPGAVVLATDLSAAALKLALRNARRHGCAGRIRFIKEDLHKPQARPGGWADLVISNPPYVPSSVVPTLEPEVLNEPRLALDGGADGLKALRAVIAEASRRLKPGAALVLEIGFDQGESVSRLLKQWGFEQVDVRRDAQGRERIASGRRPR